MSLSFYVDKGLKFLKKIHQGDFTDLDNMLRQLAGLPATQKRETRLAIVNLTVFVMNGPQEVQEAIKGAGKYTDSGKAPATRGMIITLCHASNPHHNPRTTWTDLELLKVQNQMYNEFMDKIYKADRTRPGYTKDDLGYLSTICSLLQHFPFAVKALPPAQRHA